MARAFIKSFLFIYFFVGLYSAKAQQHISKVQKISNLEGGLGNIIKTDERFGNRVANIGDLDGDGVEDMAVNGDFSDVSGSDNKGALYILFMKADGTVKSKQKLDQSNGNLAVTFPTGSRFGFSACSLGDLDGDGVQDLAAGAVGEDSYSGALYILFMKTDGTVKSAKRIGSSSTNFTTLDTDDLFALDVCGPGDIDGDGVRDLVATAPMDDDGGTNRGAVYIMFLNSNGTLKSYQKISSTNGSFSATLDNDDRFGIGLCHAGDLNGDGTPDIAVAATRDDDGATDAGAVYLIALQSNGKAKSYTKLSNNQTNFSGVLKSVDYFGQDICFTADKNGDGIADLYVGAEETDEGGTNRGVFYLLYLDASHNIKSYQRYGSNTKALNGKINNEDDFGSAVAAFDNFTKDSFTAVAIGSFRDDESVTDAGSVYMLFLASHDIAVDTILPLPSTVCYGANTQIKFVLRNHGDTLSPIPVGIKLTGPDTILLTETISDTLNPESEDTFLLNEVFTPVKGGNYTLIVYSNLSSDEYHLNDTAIVTIKLAPKIDSLDLGADITMCEGQTLELKAGNSAYKHLWSTSDTTENILVNTTGTYWAKIYYDNCTYTDTIRVTFLKVPEVNLGNDTLLCGKTEWSLDAANTGSKYIWSSGDTTQNITVTTSGTYWVKAYNGGCFDTDTINLTLKPRPMISLGPDTSLCVGQILQLDAGNPADKHVWSTGDTAKKITIDTTGTYWVKVDNGYCIATDTIHVSYIDYPINKEQELHFCQGDVGILDADNAGALYKWSNGDTTRQISVSIPGTYWVKVSNGHCSITDTMTVSFLNYPETDLDDSVTICEGDPLLADAGDKPYTYRWSTGDSTHAAIISSSGLYWVEVCNEHCKIVDTIGVTILKYPKVDLGNDTTICQGTGLTLDAFNKGAQYLWSTGATTQTLTTFSGGTFWVRVSNGLCSVTDTIQINTVNYPKIDLGSDTALCQGEWFILKGGDTAYNYHWSTGSNADQILVNEAGTYWVEVSNGNCVTIDTIKVYVLQYPDVNLGADTTVCETTDIILDAMNTGSSFIWSTGDTTQFIHPSASGIYWVKVNNGRCERQDTISIHFSALPFFTGSKAVQLCTDNNYTALLTADSATSYFWSTGDTTRNIQVSEKGIYSVTLKNKEGCSAQYSINVTNCVNEQIFVPNSFSPNSDRLNDEFMAYGDKPSYFSMMIYNRWGEIIFRTNDMTMGWDGNFKGAEAPDGIYIYYVEYRFSSGGELKKLKGNFRLQH